MRLVTSHGSSRMRSVVIDTLCCVFGMRLVVAVSMQSPRDAQRDESKQAKRSLTTFRESRRAEKWDGNERNIDTCEYERCTKQEGLQKKEARGVSKSLRSSHQATVHILGKRSRKPIDGDFQWRSGSKTSIASHALVPTETPMRPL